MSEQINELVTALAKAQAEMQNAPYNQTNPAFKSKYADLASIRDATIPSLTKHIPPGSGSSPPTLCRSRTALTSWARLSRMPAAIAGRPSVG
jgi:hypothetical protein